MKHLIPALAVALLFGFAACDSMTETATDGPSASSHTGPLVTPTLQSKPDQGIVTCADVGLGAAQGYLEVKWDFENGVFVDENGDPINSNLFSLTSNGTTLAFQGTGVLVYGALIKGGPNSNFYNYTGLGGTDHDSGLTAPNRTASRTYGISNVTFCYKIVEECTWKNETAWSAGSRYVTQGNWATFTSYMGEEKTVDLIAGQFHKIGEVTFAPEGDNVRITILLNEDGRFQDVSENVKIQGYDEAPSRNPAPGQFTTHKGDASGPSYSVVVPSSDFYGVHVDGQRQICNPPTE